MLLQRSFVRVPARNGSDNANGYHPDRRFQYYIRRRLGEPSGDNLGIKEHAINVLFGPAGGGKSTLLRAINRLNHLTDVKEVKGSIRFKEENILDPKLDVTWLRRRIGIVFSRPMPLPMTVSQNVTYGLEVAGEHDRRKLDEAAEKALRQVFRGTRSMTA